MSSPGRVLLDTCVVIDLERLDLSSLATAVPAISTVTIAELAYGLDSSDPVERFKRSERYHGALEQFQALSFDLMAAKIYGTMASLLRVAGSDPRPRRMDLQIAATASAHQIPLVTRNAKDFLGLERVLRVISV
jgi:predicted nucleic acid-binding protein